MATTKVATAIWSSQALVADEADTTATAVNLTDGYGATLNIKLTNGATGPTVAAQVEVQVSEDNSEWYEVWTMTGKTGNNAVAEWGMMRIEMGTQYLRLVAGSNTGQNVTVDADLSEVTAV